MRNVYNESGDDNDDADDADDADDDNRKKRTNYDEKSSQEPLVQVSQKIAC